MNYRARETAFLKKRYVLYTVYIYKIYSTHPMYVQCSFCVQNCFQDVVDVVCMPEAVEYVFSYYCVLMDNR